MDGFGKIGRADISRGDESAEVISGEAEVTDIMNKVDDEVKNALAGFLKPWETGLDHTDFFSSLEKAGCAHVAGDVVVVRVWVEGEVVKFKIGVETLELPMIYKDLVRLSGEAVRDIEIYSPELEAGICLITSEGEVIDLRNK